MKERLQKIGLHTAMSLLAYLTVVIIANLPESFFFFTPHVSPFFFDLEFVDARARFLLWAACLIPVVRLVTKGTLRPDRFWYGTFVFCSMFSWGFATYCFFAAHIFFIGFGIGVIALFRFLVRWLEDREGVCVETDFFFRQTTQLIRYLRNRLNPNRADAGR